MRAHQIMTRPVITVTPEATIVDAANTMLQKHVSGLPVVDATGKLVGAVSEGDFIRERFTTICAGSTPSLGCI
jgi:CBS domain-containing protein